MGNPTKEQVSAAIAVELIKCGAMEQKTGMNPSSWAAAVGVGSKYNIHPDKITPEVAEKIQAVLAKMDPSGPRPGMDAAKAVGLDLTSGQIMSHDIKAIAPAIMKTVGDKSVEEMQHIAKTGIGRASMAEKVGIVASAASASAAESPSKAPNALAAATAQFYQENKGCKGLAEVAAATSSNSIGSNHVNFRPPPKAECGRGA